MSDSNIFSVSASTGESHFFPTQKPLTITTQLAKSGLDSFMTRQRSPGRAVCKNRQPHVGNACKSGAKKKRANQA